MRTHSMTFLVRVNDTLGNEQALFERLADTVPEMEEKSLGDTQGGAQALNDLLSDTWRDIGQCSGTCRHAG